MGSTRDRGEPKRAAPYAGLLVAATGLALLMAACTPGAAPGSTPGASVVSATPNGSSSAIEQVEIWSSLPRQGSSKGQTDQMANAIALAVNQRGGSINGVKVIYADKDDSTADAAQWTEAAEIANATQAANRDVVVAWIGPLNSGAAKISIPILCKAGLVMVSPGNTYPGLTKPKGEPDEPDKYYVGCEKNYTRVQAADDLQGFAGAKWAAQLGFTKVYLVDDSDLYGKGIADVFESEATGQSIEVVGRSGILGTEGDYKALAERIRVSGATLVYFGGVTTKNAGQLWRDIRSAVPGMALMAPDGIFEDAFLEAAGPAAEGTYVTFAGLPLDQLGTRGGDFAAAYQAEYGTGADSIEANAVLAYDAANAVLDAIERALAQNPATLGDLRELVRIETKATRDFDGALGRWSFDQNGDTSLVDMSGYQVVNDRFVFIEVIR